MQTITHWIDGRRHDGSGDRSGDVYDPNTGDVRAQVAMGTAHDVDAAVRSAATAFPGWRDTSISKRTRIMFSFRELFEARKQDLARTISSEHGKVFEDAMGEVHRGLEVVEFACGIAHLLKGDLSENVSTDIDAYTIRQPLGVVAGVSPFNFPVMVPMWMYPIAIACGNSFVLKPSERDPSAAILMAELFAEAGLPDGVFNVVQGDKEAVNALIAHPDVSAVSSVGSTPVARHIYRTATDHGKRVQALGGAKNHAMVLPDADMELAADALTSAAYGSAGERCMAISAVVAVGDAGDALLSRLHDRIKAITVGHSLDADSDMGPLITGEHRDRVRGYVDAGVAEGADLPIDGRDLVVDGYEDGFFLGPCLFDRVTTGMTIYTDEMFGPVLIMLRVDTFAEALEIINANPYGNGTAIFTNDGTAARTFQRDVTVGMVGVNVPIPVPLAFYSFGGWKASLFGDLHVHGPEGVMFYTQGKFVTTRWPSPARRGVDLGFPTT